MLLSDSNDGRPLDAAKRIYYRKIFFVSIILLVLALLKDGDESGHLAVWTALSRHPPSLRVFRALLEVSVLLVCCAFFLRIGIEASGARVVSQLLFQSSLNNNNNTAYRPVSIQEDDNDNDDNDENVLLDKKVVEQAPDPMAVAGAALDLMLFILISLLLFTISSSEGGKYIDGMHGMWLGILARFAAPVFPLLLFVGASLWVLFPWKRRQRFWVVISYTLQAPFCDVTFRDGFVGDVLTSSVRPMQDLAFTLFYLASGLKGWWNGSTLDNGPVETSWLLRTIVLPACMISPLWWRFMQNLRQCYHYKRRWPYLGNALKYLVAAQVAMVGVYIPSQYGTPLWLVAFVLSTLYQVWWDIFMDWELFHGTSLRDKRLYSSRVLYWLILLVNVVLRFGWTLTFLPARYLDETGVLRRTFRGQWYSVVEHLLASAELIRRTLWGLLRLELETIKCFGDDPTVPHQLHDDNGVELVDIMKQADAQLSLATKEETVEIVSVGSNVQILVELAMWATAFAAGGILAAIHRGTF